MIEKKMEEKNGITQRKGNILKCYHFIVNKNLFWKNKNKIGFY